MRRCYHPDAELEREHSNTRLLLRTIFQALCRLGVFGIKAQRLLEWRNRLGAIVACGVSFTQPDVGQGVLIVFLNGLLVRSACRRNLPLHSIEEPEARSRHNLDENRVSCELHSHGIGTAIGITYTAILDKRDSSQAAYDPQLRRRRKS